MHQTQTLSVLVFGALLFVSMILSSCDQAEASPEIEDLWMASAHAAESRAFTRWNDEDPPEIPTNCAKCHSTIGYHDFLGLDGSTPGQVDHPAPVGTTVECEACHNDVSIEKSTVVVPSGAELIDLGSESDCMECHQGRTSTVSVDEATTGLEDDVVDSELSFINVHNKAAAPTQYGTLAKGGYEYDEQAYVGQYEHVAEFDTCIECHDAHLLEVYGERCSACHIGALTKRDRQNIRVTNIDYDGDGDTKEGLADEINTMRDRLLTSMQIYAARTEGVANIAYEDRNPYFFDENDEGYSTWTPRLLRAAYNYHYTTKEPGGYAHNGRYHIQLIYDSLRDLGFEIPNMTRPETG